LGLAAALAVVLLTRTYVGEAAFTAQWWRVPFLLSAGLFAVSVFMRLRLQESPAFRRIRDEGKLSRAPLVESFFKWKNLRLVILVLFVLMMPQGTIWYTVHFYLPSFLEKVLKVDPVTINLIMIKAVAVSAVLYVFFAWLSDIIGRKIVMLFGI